MIVLYWKKYPYLKKQNMQNAFWCCLSLHLLPFLGHWCINMHIMLPKPCKLHEFILCNYQKYNLTIIYNTIKCSLLLNIHPFLLLFCLFACLFWLVGWFSFVFVMKRWFEQNREQRTRTKKWSATFITLQKASPRAFGSYYSVKEQ